MGVTKGASAESWPATVRIVIKKPNERAAIAMLDDAVFLVGNNDRENRTVVLGMHEALTLSLHSE